jgi:hypothetical protein
MLYYLSIYSFSKATMIQSRVARIMIDSVDELRSGIVSRILFGELVVGLWSWRENITVRFQVNNLRTFLNGSNSGYISRFQ